jgi:hypothetical protein
LSCVLWVRSISSSFSATSRMVFSMLSIRGTASASPGCWARSTSWDQGAGVGFAFLLEDLDLVDQVRAHGGRAGKGTRLADQGFQVVVQLQPACALGDQLLVPGHLDILVVNHQMGGRAAAPGRACRSASPAPSNGWCEPRSGRSGRPAA